MQNFFQVSRVKIERFRKFGEKSKWGSKIFKTEKFHFFLLNLLKRMQKKFQVSRVKIERFRKFGEKSQVGVKNFQNCKISFFF